MIEKLENTANTLASKDRQIANLENQKKSIEIELQKKGEENEELRGENKEQKQQLNKRIEELRIENQKLNDQIIVLKLENNRETALTSQKIEFLEHKISELQDQNRTDSQKYEDRLDALKQDLRSDADRQTSKMQSEFD